MAMIPSFSRACMALLFTAALHLGSGPLARGQEKAGARPAIDFQRQIRPILSDNCFRCHGPDEAERKAKLRLDTRAGALGKLRGGERAIVPGQPQESILLE